MFTLRTVNDGDVSTNWTKQLMLRLLIHLVGDIHQPLHSISLFTSDFPNGDYNGNLFQINFNGSAMVLHALWDSAFLTLSTRYPRPLSQSHKQILINKAIEFMNLYPYTKFNVSSIENENFNDWSKDAYSLGIQYGYLNNQLTPGSTIDSNYTTQGYPIIQSQITLAGYRLAYLIEKYAFNIVIKPPPNNDNNDNQIEEQLKSTIKVLTVFLVLLSLLSIFLISVLIYLIVKKKINFNYQKI